MDGKLRSLIQYVLVNGEGVKNYVLNCPYYVQNNLNVTKSVIVLHWRRLVDNETDLISIWHIFSAYLIKLVASKECAGFLSVVFIIFLCVLVNSSYDLKYYNLSNTGQNNSNEDQNGNDDQFNSIPKSVLKKIPSNNFTPIRSKSNASQNGTPYSSVSTLTPDSNYKNMRSIMHRHSDSEHKSDENDPHSRLSGEDNSDDNNSQYAPSEGTMMSGYSKIDFLMYENEIMKSAVDDPRVLIGWRVLVKGQGSGTVLSIKKIKFSTTKFVVQFDSGIVKTLALKRSDTKGKVPFTLITKINNN